MADRGTRPAAPPTARGRQTREALIDAARTVFEKNGFLDARVTDITQAAGVAHGTFYTYFSSKDEVFREITDALVEELFDASRIPPGTPPDPVSRIEAANRGYVEAFARNARMLAVVYQVATFNERLRRIAGDVRKRFVERSAQGLRRLQEEGLADPQLDPEYAGSCLGAMVEYSTYLATCVGEHDDPEALLRTLTRLWAQAIGLRDASARR